LAPRPAALALLRRSGGAGKFDGGRFGGFRGGGAGEGFGFDFVFAQGVRLSLLSFALGLEFQKQVQVLVDDSGEALFAEGERVEGFGLSGEGSGVGEGEMDLGVFGVDARPEGEGFGGEEVFFDGFEAVEAPVVDSDGSGELDFEVAAGVEFADEFADVEDLLGSVFFGHYGRATGEGVIEAVEFGERHAFLSLDLDSGMGVGWFLGRWVAGC